MVGRTEAEAREVAADLTGRPGAELTLERGECLSCRGQGCSRGIWVSEGADAEGEKAGSGYREWSKGPTPWCCQGWGG